MRKWFIGSLVIMLIAVFSLGANAKPGKFQGNYGKDDGNYGKDYGDQEKQEKASWHHDQNDARYIIHRTAAVIFAAQRAAEHGRRYLGLGQAVAHQQMAWDLYGKGSYRYAIFHSLRARNMAFQIIAANRGRMRNEYYRDQMEESYAQRAPRDNELDIGIESLKIGKDDAAVHFSFHLDLAQ